MFNKKFWMIFMGIFILGPVLSEEVSKDSEYATRSFPDFLQSVYETYLQNHVEVGTRMVHFVMVKDKDEDGYVGSIDKLDEKQNYDPTRVFVDVFFYSFKDFHLGVETTWERLAMNTITTSNGQNDGTLELSGPVFTFIGRYEANESFRPYAGFGLVYFNRTHITKGWWHHGFNYPGDQWEIAEQEYYWWRVNGSQSWPNGGYTRTFELDSTWGTVFVGGIGIHVWKKWEADIYFRYTHAVIDNTYTMAFYGNPVDVRYSEFDVSNYAFGVGVRYKI